MLADYLALPEVQFILKYWPQLLVGLGLALAILALIGLALQFWLDETLDDAS